MKKRSSHQKYTEQECLREFERLMAMGREMVDKDIAGSRKKYPNPMDDLAIGDQREED